MVPHARFVELLQDIEPSATTKADAATSHRALRDHLWADPTFKLVMVTDFLSGSYKRDTAIRPRRVGDIVTRPDVDTIVVTSHSEDDDPAEVVDGLYWAVRRGYPDSRRQARSVGIITRLADMDVVPIIEPYGNGVYFIPDRKLERWLRTNPPGHTTWTTTMNAAAGGRFKPLVKMMKWWRRHNQTVSKRPKGFVLECLAADCMDLKQPHFGELFVGTLEKIAEKYGPLAAVGIVPHLEDPGVPGNSVMRGMTVAAFQGFMAKVEEHAKLGRSALDEADLSKATERWRTIFGPRFPATEVREASSLLKAATPPAVGFPAGGSLGSSGGSLSFPNHPVTPSRPAGFA
ncbi:MAG: nucleotidyltransferase [Azospirillum brasilense]|nr:MAG: nucleotidyltransferase [Azospirillum brasilense]